ncbi:hypothetical protein [Pseudoclavibacter sp. AY1H1]|uniref:hypothetical protein n=1 Tax=Pseudoclavibacter sp. AY1H1 TaxID=2080584 RepID=UPI0011B06E27|nr:hypothetical protein [Pseudoclavibacter sp. AY1H1]
MIATLHVRGKSGGCDVTVAAQMLHPRARKVTTEEFQEALEHSDALEALFDFARIQARVVMAIVESDDQVPVASPEPEFSTLNPAGDDEPEEIEPQ